jgi:hypothetical protein
MCMSCVHALASVSARFSRDSGSLRAGPFGDRIPVGTKCSAPVQTGQEAHTAFYAVGIGSSPGLKRPGRGVNHPPHLAARLKKGRAIPLLPLWAFVACSRVNFTIFKPSLLYYPLQPFWVQIVFQHFIFK